MVLYWFWEFDVPTNSLRPRTKFIKQEYQGDLLVTYTLSGDETPRVVAIPPLLSSYADGAAIKVAPPQLTYKWLCSCVVVRDGHKTLDIFSHVSLYASDHPITFSWHRSIPIRGGIASSGYTATITKAYIREIEQQVGERLGLLRHRAAELE